MIPVEITPFEARQVGLLARRHGAEADLFKIRKLAAADRRTYTVRVVGRGAATLYETEDPYEWMSQFAADLGAGLFGTSESGHGPQSVRGTLEGIELELAQGGLASALKVLNDRVPHRFTAVYRLEGPLLRNIATVDKHLHLDPLDLRTVPLKDSFCQFVLRDGLFVTSSSGDDTRLAGHPYQGVMKSYVGVPIRRADAMVGSLCHFDLDDHEIADDEYLLLEQVARLLPSFVA